MGLAIIERLIAAVIALLVLIVLAIVCALVVDRYIVNVPLAAPDEIAKIAMVWLTFVGFSLALRDRATIRVDLLDTILPAKVRAVLATVFDFVILGLIGLLIVKGWTLVELGANQLILGTPLTAAVPNFGFFLGMVLAFLFVTRNLLQRLFG